MRHRKPTCQLLGWILATGVVVGVLQDTAQAATPQELIATLKAVGHEGQGNLAAQQALQQLTAQDATLLPTLLDSFDGASPLGLNYLRSVFETIADRTIESGAKLPAQKLEQFVLNTKNNANARRLAYEWLKKTDDTLEARVIPQLLQDPSAEFRYDAVARLLDEAEQAEGNQATELYKKALQGAVNRDQVKTISTALKKAGEDVDLQKHFGFLTDWQIIGPFDNTDKKGFPIAYPPEEKIDFEAKYQGKEGEVSWASITTDDDYGLINIATQIARHKGAVMYATTEVVSQKDQTVEFRLGTPNAWKLWLNDKLEFAREEYHRGTAMDQYRITVDLKKGRNVILLKVLQNEQTDAWAQRYQYQLRISDPAGSAIQSVRPQQSTSLTPEAEHLFAGTAPQQTKTTGDN